MKKLNISLNIFVLIFIGLASLPSCERAKTENSKLILKMPGVDVSSKTSVNSSVIGKVTASASSDGANGNNWNTALNPGSVSEVDCYAVFVGGGAEPAMNVNQCEIGATSGLAANTHIHFGPYVGFVKAGGEIAVDVPSGQRKIYLIGLREAPGSGACKSFVAGSGEDPNLVEPDSANLSQPMLLGSPVVNLVPGTQEVPIYQVLDNTQIIQDCTFMNKKGTSPGTVATAPFGDGRDGDFTISSSVLNFTTDSYSSNGVAHGANPNNIPNSKIISAMRRVVGLSTDHRELTLSPAITTNDFAVGDEVLWHVSAGASGVGGGDDSGVCGVGLYRGLWGSAKVQSTSASSMTLDAPVGPSTGALANSTNYTETIFSNSTSNPFCVIQVVRVPNFNQLTISSAGSWTAQGFSWTSGSIGGGLLAFKAKKIILNASLTVNMIGLGFPGVSMGPGSGLSGASGENGGSYSSSYGGGGGNGGAGGMTSSASPGSSLPYCGNSMSCYPFRDFKFFFGGAGGGGSTHSGGAGGGAIIMQAEEITGTASNTLLINANGAAAGSNAGGGAGGSVYLAVKKLSTSSLSISTNGGDGDSPSYSGSGGSGSLELQYCSSLASTAPILSSIAGVATGSPSTTGGLLAPLTNLQPSFCQ